MNDHPLWRWLGAIVICAAGYAVYRNSLAGPFIFDDIISIVDSPNLRSLSPLTEAMSGPDGSTASGRPLVALSLALNYAYGQLNVFGYHAFNLVTHLVTALFLFGFTTRALKRTDMQPQATLVAFSASMLWVVHPLNTDALNQISSRGEVLVALFVLAALYFLDRAHSAPGKKAWALLAILASAAAMLSKEIAVSLPLLALAYDRTFVSGTFTKAWQERRGLYVGMALTWLALIVAVYSGERGSAVGFGQEFSSLDYLRTQAQGLVHYVHLALWPTELSVDYYGWEPVQTWGPAILPGSMVLLVLFGSLYAFIRGSRAAWAILAIFAILSPSSSFIPITGEWLAEHRMYLPLSGLCVLFVVGANRLTMKRGRAWPAWITIIICLLLTAPLSKATVRRNEDYSSAVQVWEACLELYPENARAHDHLAAIWLGRGQYETALVHSEQALLLDSSLDTVHYNAGTILQQLGRHERSLEQFKQAQQQQTGKAPFHANLGVALAQTGDPEAGIQQLRRATEIDPDYAIAYRNLGALLLDAGDSPAALKAFQRSLVLEVQVPTLMQTIRILASDPNPRARDGAEALRLSKFLIASEPPDPRWFDLLGMSHARLGQFEAALKATRKALEGAEQLKQPELATQLRERLVKYDAHQPYTK